MSTPTSAMPVTAPLSTSDTLVPSATRDETAAPTAPLGAPAAWATLGRVRAASVSTGASLTAVTAMSAVALAALNWPPAPSPPFAVVSLPTVVPAVPEV
ncbi:hypothetical protein [Azospirillum baldaniorum]|uniref:hypothetical protein n=1 Tax=Azospirillum baldaniorum TaxID=1064539 RepID=UPI00117F02CE|nr:hypothetical protein [Azospirillum baldaniorum]